jgi:hypothetical protein
LVLPERQIERILARDDSIQAGIACFVLLGPALRSSSARHERGSG